MNNFKWEVALLFLPILLLVLALLFYFNQPKQINFWCGYRTKSSMKNSDTWTTANKIAARWFLILSSVLVVLLLIIILVLEKASLISIFGSIKTFFFYIIGTIHIIITASILIVEYQLNKIFDAIGDRK